MDGNGAVSTNPLAIASENGHDGIVKVLLENGANVNGHEPSILGRLLAAQISLVAQNGHERIVKMLHDKGVNVNRHEPSVLRPLLTTLILLAAGNGHEQVAKMLVDNVAEVGGKRYDNYDTSLFWASQNDDEQVMRYILTKAPILNSSLKILAKHCSGPRI